MPMDSNPGPFGSVTGDPGASRSVHFCPEEVNVTIAMADTLPNSATYTPPPFPVCVIGASPPRYDQFRDSPASALDVQPGESLPVSLLKKRALTAAPCVLTAYTSVSSGLNMMLLALILAVDV